MEELNKQENIIHINNSTIELVLNIFTKIISTFIYFIFLKVKNNFCSIYM